MPLLALAANPSGYVQSLTYVEWTNLKAACQRVLAPPELGQAVCDMGFKPAQQVLQRSLLRHLVHPRQRSER